MRRTARPLLLILAAAVVPLALAACDSSTGPDDDHEEHADPASMRLMVDGEEIASADRVESPDEIQVAAGEDTGPIDVEFLDEDGDVVVLDEDDFYLEVEVEDESVATFEQDTPGAFEGEVHGQAEGTTTMTFKIMHGSVGSGHEDFVFAAIDVSVLP